MERIYNVVNENATALVLANPGTMEEKIYFIRDVITSSSGAWFRSDVNLPRGTPTIVFLQLKYGMEIKYVRVKFYGKVVRCESGGFGIAFEMGATYHGRNS